MKKIQNFILVITYILVLSGCNIDNEQLLSSKLILTDSKEIESLNIIRDDLNDTQLFFVGEIHGLSINNKIEVKFIKYLKKNGNLKYYLPEIPHSYSVILNQYLETGDDKWLNFFEDTGLIPERILIPWREIYLINQGLPDIQKITSIGIDIEQRPIISFIAISEIFSKYSNSESEKINTIDFDLIIQQLANNEMSDSIMKGYLNLLRAEIQLIQSKELYFSEEDKFSLNFILDNIENWLEVKSYSNLEFNKKRDALLYDNFKKIYKFYPKGKMFGQWGVGHILQKQTKDIKWLAVFLQDNLLKNKMLSVLIIYENSECNYNNKIYRVNTINTKIKKEIDDIEHSTIYKLDYEQSKYRERLIWPMNNDDSMFTIKVPTEGVTTDYFQYIIYIENEIN